VGGIAVPEVEGEIKMLTISHPRRSISIEAVLRVMRVQAGVTPASLKTALRGVSGLKKRRLARWAVYYCYEYTDISVEELAGVFGVHSRRIVRILHGNP